MKKEVTKNLFSGSPKDASSTVSQSIWFRVGKRPFDILTASLLILVLAPLGLILALALKLSSQGPVLFLQERGGLNGRPFRALKFRSMRSDRKPNPKELVPLAHSEITPLGKLLRRFKLDELPQLLNVLKGDMSLIGPRPTLLDQITVYDDFRRQRLLIKPGLTGLAQVYCSSMVSWNERILFDIAYVHRGNLRLDFHILMRTVLVIFIGEAKMTRPFTQTRFQIFVEPPSHYWEFDPGDTSGYH